MDGAKLSPFPHLAWFHFRVQGNATGHPLSFHLRSVVHSVSLTLRGHHAVRQICRGRERGWDECIGTVHFLPRDDEDHNFITTMSPDCESAVFLIPRGHLRQCLDADGARGPVEFQRLLAHDDPILQGCLVRLAAACRSTEDTAAIAADEAARRLVLRLAESAGGGRPDWSADGSSFDRVTLGNFVQHIDAHLRIAPGVAEMARLAGLSPSHFARKFRLSTGLSLHRFINRRRLQLALEQLKSPAASLAEIALELGFSSQSHFTHQFSRLTGLTPAKYAKQYRRTIG